MMEQLEELDSEPDGDQGVASGCVFDLLACASLICPAVGLPMPQAALNGHDRLMSNTRLEGCALSRDSCLDLLGYAHRTNSVSAGWIPRGLLMEGKTGGEPGVFPPGGLAKSGHAIASVPDLAESDTSLTPAARLQRLILS